MQKMIPPEKMGRVSSVDTLGSYVLIPTGFGFTGWLIDAVGFTTVFCAAGGATAIFSLLRLLHSPIRKLD